MKSIEPLVFLFVGNFISACFNKNWFWLNLLRSPLVFKGSLKNTYLEFNLPVWFPTSAAVLNLDGGRIHAKVKDLPFPNKEEVLDQKIKCLYINIEMLQNQLILKAELSYSPLLRYVIEPANFDLKKAVASYLIGIIDYELRRNGQLTSVTQFSDGSSVSFSGGKDLITAQGQAKLSHLRIYIDNTLAGFFDFEEPSLGISDQLAPVLTRALEAHVTESKLANLSIFKWHQLTVLSYAG